MKYPNVPPKRFLHRLDFLDGVIGIERLYFVLDYGGKRIERHRGTNLQGTLRREVLRERDIKVRLRIFSENAVLAVARHTDDLDEGASIAGQTKAFADGVFARPKMPGHRFVDDRDARRCLAVGVREGAAEEHTNAERFEIGCIDAVEQSSGRLFGQTARVALRYRPIGCREYCPWEPTRRGSRIARREARGFLFRAER